MKIKSGYILKDVAGSKIVMAIGEESTKFNGIITFNEVGAEVFTMLDGTKSVEEIVAKIAKDYEAPYEIVAEDVNKLIEKMRNQGLIED